MEQMIGILFLDIEGAFPNANLEQLIHNLKMRQVPLKITNLVKNMLQDWKTKLCFDDYESDYFMLTNGIGQGGPLSMILYIFYNTDFLNIPANANEYALGFVDDSALIAEGPNEHEITRTLSDMMERPTGGLNWCNTHNSKLSLPKTTYLLATQKCIPGSTAEGLKTIPRPRHDIKIGSTIIPASEFAKYLGIYLDQELQWKEQAS
jgi:hypothetical protein